MRGKINCNKLLQGIVWEISKQKIFLDAGLNRHFDRNDPYTSEEFKPLDEIGLQLFKERYYNHFEELALSIEGNNNISEVLLNIQRLIFFLNEKNKPGSFVVKNIYRDGRPVGSLVVKTEGVNKWVNDNITNVLSEQIPKLENLAELFPARADGKTELPFESPLPDNLKISAEKFDEIERWLITQKYLSPDGAWINTKKELAALLQFLIDSDIFKTNDKTTKDFRTKIRDSFVLRYKAEKINDQFIPTKITMKAKKVFNTMSFIINPVSH